MADKILLRQKDNAGCFGLAVSVFYPLLGVLLYFIQKDSVNNPHAYIRAALVGLAIKFILGFIVCSVDYLCQ